MTNTPPKDKPLEPLAPTSSLEADVPVKRKRGRPKKGDIVAKQVKGKVGRPKGDAAIINEYKARMLNSPKSQKVIEAIYNAALDDEHKHQSAAWKLVIDRILPVAAFEKDIVKGSGNSAIQINITGVGQVSTEEKVINDEDYSDGA